MQKIILLCCALCFSISVYAQQSNHSKEPLVVFLVRHAEKVDNSRDPELSEKGKVRALELADILKSAEIDFVHSTDYIRTRETAKPTAKQFNLEMQLYNPRELAAFAKEIQNSGGRHLVVGHSNTTPELVKLLGGTPGDPIVEKNEYDRLYILTITKKRKVETVLMRYGYKYID